MASEQLTKECTELRESHMAWLQDPTKENTTRYTRAKNEWIAAGLSYRNDDELAWTEQTGEMPDAMPDMAIAKEHYQAEVERLTKWLDDIEVEMAQCPTGDPDMSVWCLERNRIDEQLTKAQAMLDYLTE
jgi:hypothetical protein